MKLEISNPITIDLLLYTIEKIRKTFSESSEAIPIYTEKEIDELFNCIERVYLGYHSSVEERLSNIMYNITKGHYLSNGNKRVAVIITLILYWTEYSEIHVIKKENTPVLNNGLIESIVMKIADGSIDKDELLEIICKDKLFPI